MIRVDSEQIIAVIDSSDKPIACVIMQIKDKSLFIYVCKPVIEEGRVTGYYKPLGYMLGSNSLMYGLTEKTNAPNRSS